MGWSVTEAMWCDEALCLGHVALAVRHQHARVGHHEHADGGEALVPGRAQRLVGVDAFGELAQAREVLLGVAARERVGGADQFVGRNGVSGSGCRAAPGRTVSPGFVPGTTAREAAERGYEEDRLQGAESCGALAVHESAPDDGKPSGHHPHPILESFAPARKRGRPASCSRAGLHGLPGPREDEHRAALFGVGPAGGRRGQRGRRTE